MERKIVHVVGTGTIGEPLIGLLCDYQGQLGIDEITFHKNSALKIDKSKVVDLLKRGARLAVDDGKENDFKNAFDKSTKHLSSGNVFQYLTKIQSA